MFKTNNNLIAFGLEMLIGIAFAVFVFPAAAGAQTGYNYTYVSGNPPVNNYYYQYQTPVYAYPTPANRVVYVYPTPAPTGTITMVSSVDLVKSSESSDKTIVETEKKDGKLKDLTSNVIFGKGGFMPSGLMQWILVAILVLFIVILVRKTFGGEKEYHSTPLKHS